MVRRAGAVPVVVQLRPPNWSFQLEGEMGGEVKEALGCSMQGSMK